MTVLNKKDYARFERLIEDGLKHPVGLVPTPRLNNADLMKRINDNDMTHFPPKTERPSKVWRDFDIRHGNRRFEAIFSVNRAVRFIQKLFKKGEKK